MGLAKTSLIWLAAGVVFVVTLLSLFAFLELAVFLVLRQTNPRSDLDGMEFLVRLFFIGVPATLVCNTVASIAAYILAGRAAKWAQNGRSGLGLKVR